jgi:hypothetical protein
MFGSGPSMLKARAMSAAAVDWWKRPHISAIQFGGRVAARAAYRRLASPVLRPQCCDAHATLAQAIGTHQLRALFTAE